MSAVNDQLFRREYGRMVGVLTRVFGVHNIALAEDVVQEAFCRAIETWSHRGLPENPSAWLMTTAKNCALDVLRRERTSQRLESEVSRFLQSEWTLAPAVEELFGSSAIKDDLLRMMFSCCGTRLTQDAQVALILHILCGFSVQEIAHAFVCSEASIAKRLSRAKSALARSGKLFDVTAAADFAARLPAVLHALYLLFNEGYHATTPDTAVRAELCHEAMRLTSLLLDHPFGNRPETSALAALMCLNAARLPARTDGSGDLLSLFEADRSLWDMRLVDEGMAFLANSASGNQISQYHVEAALASVHAAATTIENTDWAHIVSLYDILITIRPSPIVGLNRAIAIAQLCGPARGLQAVYAIVDREQLSRYPFFPAAIGEMELRRGHSGAAAARFREAQGLARNPMEQRFFAKRVAAAAEKPLNIRDYFENYWNLALDELQISLNAEEVAAGVPAEPAFDACHSKLDSDSGI